MATKLMTPGVYIEEKDSFPGSVVAVETAIPAFIGYTEKASRKGKNLMNKPVRITSFAEYTELFGGEFPARFKLKEVPKGSDEKAVSIGNKANDYLIEYEKENKSLMYPSIKLFYENGGGACYIVSVGIYEGKTSLSLNMEDLLGEKEGDKNFEGGLKALKKEQEPTMILIPDAVNLTYDQCYSVYQSVLTHCAYMQSRVAILDIHDGYKDRIQDSDPEVDIVGKFRQFIGSENLNYGAAYYPWLNTNIKQKKDVTFQNLVDAANLNKLLPEKKAIELLASNSTSDKSIADLKKDKPKDYIDALTKDGRPVEIKEVIDPPPFTEKMPTQPDDNPEELARLKAAFEDRKKQFDEDKEKFKKFKSEFPPEKIKDRKKEIADFDKDIDKKFQADELKNLSALLKNYNENNKRNLHLGLIATSPTYSDLLEEVCNVMNLLPPSSAMAGLYTMVDNSRGVWKSPANISVNRVIKPSSNITHEQQENLNVDATSGKSINAIRTFPGIGTLVWGGRTLDGNSLDWQYINVRRTMIMLEQSIKLALRAYVFEPNDANTWVTVKSMIVNFLTEKWKQGALAGSSPEDAFQVNVGLGSTMTSLDILEGKMLVSVKLAIVRPAEFIVVTFEQQMQKS